MIKPILLLFAAASLSLAGPGKPKKQGPKITELDLKKAILASLRAVKDEDEGQPNRVRYAEKNANMTEKEIPYDLQPTFYMYIDKKWQTDLDHDGIKDWVVHYIMEIYHSGSGAEGGWAAISGKPPVKKTIGLVHSYSHLEPGEIVVKVVGDKIHVNREYEEGPYKKYKRVVYAVRKGKLVEVKR